MARATSIRTRTRPISKMMARSFGAGMGLFNLAVKYGRPERSIGGLPGTEYADDGRKNGNDDDDGNDIVNVLADVGDEMAERVAAKDHGANPEDAAKNIEEKISRIRHFCGACDGRTKRSNDGDEARENYGPAAVFFVEIVGALEMAAAEKEGILAAVKCGAGGTANPVADLVAGDGAEHDRQQKPLEGNDARVGEDSGGDQKGVAWKEKADKKAGFDEDDGANERSAAGAN